MSKTPIPTTSTHLVVPGVMAVNPFKYSLSFSQWTTGPSYILLTLFSVLLIYIIFKHCWNLLQIYISMLFYIVSQLLLLITLTVSWVIEEDHMQETEVQCEIKAAFQTFAMMLPGYCILIITLVRSVFLTYPFSHTSYLKIRFQALGLGIAVIICGLIATGPSLGFCGTTLNSALIIIEEDDPEMDTLLYYCSYDDKEWSYCKAFYGVLVGIGFVLPFISVMALYFYIYGIVINARRSHRQLMTSTDRQSDESKAESKSMETSEQKSIPWSIIIILAMCLFTTLPWAVMTVLTEDIITKIAEGRYMSTFIDVFYSFLQIMIGASPLVYILTTASLRKLSYQLLHKNKVGTRGIG